MQEMHLDDGVTLAASSAGFLVNSTTLLALLLNRQRLSSKTKLLLSATVANLLTATGSMAHTLLNRESLAGLICLSPGRVLVRDVRYTGLVATVLSLAGLCVDLYVAVMHSMHYRLLCGQSRLLALIGAKWLLSALLGCASSIGYALSGWRQPECKRQLAQTPQLPPLLSGLGLNLSASADVQLPAWSHSQLRRVYISDCLLATTFAASLLLVTLLLLRIYRKLRRLHAAGASIRRHGSRAKRRGAITVLLLFLGFNCCVLPYTCGELFSVLVLAFNLSAGDTFELGFILHVMPYLSAVAVGYTVLNPVVMSLRMREVQAGYATMFGLRPARGSFSGAAASHVRCRSRQLLQRQQQQRGQQEQQEEPSQDRDQEYSLALMHNDSSPSRSVRDSDAA